MSAWLSMPDETNNNPMVTARIDRVNATFQVSQTVGEKWNSCLPLFKLDTLIFGIAFRGEKLREITLLR